MSYQPSPEQQRVMEFAQRGAAPARTATPGSLIGRPGVIVVDCDDCGEIGTVPDQNNPAATPETGYEFDRVERLFEQHLREVHPGTWVVGGPA